MISQVDVGKSYEQLEREISELADKLKVQQFKEKVHLLEKNNEVFYDKTHVDFEKELCCSGKKWREYQPFLLRWLRKKNLRSGFHLVPTLYVKCKRNDIKDMTEIIYLYCQNVEVRDVLNFGPRPFPGYVAVRTHIIWSMKQIKYDRGEYYVRKVPPGVEEEEVVEMKEESKPESYIVHHEEPGFFYHRFPDGVVHVFFVSDDQKVLRYTGPARSNHIPDFKGIRHIDLTAGRKEVELRENSSGGIASPAIAKKVKTIS